MLVLSRKKGEVVDIIVGGHVLASVMLIDIRGDKCRIGFDAAPDVIIHRREVTEAIERQGKTYDAKRNDPPPAHAPKVSSIAEFRKANNDV